MSEYKAHICLVDDDQDIQAFLTHMLEGAGYRVSVFDSAIEALKTVDESGPFSVPGKPEKVDLILSDICMPGMDGMQFIETLKTQGIEIPIILITAHGSLEMAVQAIRKGAHDYIVKPFKQDELLVAVESALNFTKLSRENKMLRNEVKQSWSFDNIIGKSRAMKSVFDLIRRVAATNANILITGESGTGKELVARAIHKNSGRANQNFVAINCSAIPENLLESELFGHAKGSFTGAYQNKKGLFEEAHHGTIFLDEIGDMDISLQAKILRVIQERIIKPVGSNVEKEVDVRIIAATHKDLRAAIKEQHFREDLYYRLSVIPIELPALRQRREDIPVLAEHFLHKHCSTHNLNIRGFTRGAQTKLMSHAWEGNVRELENIIERSALLSRGDMIGEDDLPHFESVPSPSALLEEMAMEFLSLKEVEKRYIAMILRKTGGKKERAAHILGIDRKTLYRKEKEYGISLNAEDNEPAEPATPPSETSAAQTSPEAYQHGH